MAHEPFQNVQLEDRASRRLRLSFLGSVGLHAFLLFALYGFQFYRLASDFSAFQFDDDESYEARYKVTMVNTKPLHYPKGHFTAVVEVPKVERPEPNRTDEEEERKRREREREQKAREEAIARAEEAKKAEEGTPGAEDQPATPDKPKSFGVIKTNAFKPHIKNAYAAYEKGLISDADFTVTVSCRVLPDGSLTDVKLVKSSGSDIIDNTAKTLFRELSDMHALQPLATLSSVSLTLEKRGGNAKMSAVGFANDETAASDLKLLVDTAQTVARFRMKNEDQLALVNAVRTARDGKRITVSLGMPASRAGDMMRRSFGSQAGQVADSSPGSTGAQSGDASAARRASAS